MKYDGPKSKPDTNIEKNLDSEGCEFKKTHNATNVRPRTSKIEMIHAHAAITFATMDWTIQNNYACFIAETEGVRPEKF